MSEEVEQRNGKWSPSDIAQFLELLINYPALWDMGSDAYKNRIQKLDSWRKLEEDLKAANFAPMVAEGARWSKDVLKSKLKSIRDTYSAELKKVQKSLGTGTGGDKSSVPTKGMVYAPTLAWYNQADKIFRKSCISRVSRCSVISPILSRSTSLQRATTCKKPILDIFYSFQMSLAPRPIPEEGMFDYEEDVDTPQSTDSPPSDSSDAAQTPTSQYIGRGSYRRGAKKTAQPADDINLSIKRLERLSCNKTDEYDGFGKSVAAMLRRLPQEVSWDLQDSIMRQLRVAITRNTKENQATPRVEEGRSSAQTSGEASTTSNINTSNNATAPLEVTHKRPRAESLTARKRLVSQNLDDETAESSGVGNVSSNSTNVMPNVNVGQSSTMEKPSSPAKTPLKAIDVINKHFPLANLRPDFTKYTKPINIKKENLPPSTIQKLIQQNPAFANILGKKSPESFTPPNGFKFIKVVSKVNSGQKSVINGRKVGEEKPVT